MRKIKPGPRAQKSMARGKPRRDAESGRSIDLLIDYGVLVIGSLVYDVR